MAKRIIVLDRNQSETSIIYNCLFWFPVTSGLQPQTSGSRWVAVTGGTAGASVAENDAIKAGSVKEESVSFSFPKGVVIGTIQDFVLAAWTNRNIQINGVGPYERMGTFNDSVTNWGSG